MMRSVGPGAALFARQEKPDQMHRPPPAPFTDPPHSHFRPLLVVLAGCAALCAAPAGADELTVFNHSTVDIVGIAGNPARVDGFQTILAGGNGRVQVGMPEGQ